MGQRKTSETPREIEPQTLGFRPGDSMVSEIYYEVLHTVKISNVDNVMFVSRIREMISFWARLRKRERCFSSCHKRGRKENFWVPMRNRTSNPSVIVSHVWAFSTTIELLRASTYLSSICLSITLVYANEPICQKISKQTNKHVVTLITQYTCVLKVSTDQEFGPSMSHSPVLNNLQNTS